MRLDCFKAYDIRGRIPDQLNPDVCYRIGRAYAQFLKPENVVVGFDVRVTSPEFSAALTRGLNDSGSNVIDIGLCGTEEVYFQTFNKKADGGIMVTAGHADFGIAWDGDFNRCFLFDETGRLIEGYYIVGLLASQMREKNPGQSLSQEN